MKKIYLFLCAILLAQSSFAQSIACPEVSFPSQNILIPCVSGTQACANVTAQFPDIRQTINGPNAYVVNSIPFSGHQSFNFPAGTGNAILVGQDDVYSNIINLPFTFCYYGNTYNQVVVGPNGVISFNTSYATLHDGYIVDGFTIPNANIGGGLFTSGNKLNTIFACFHDVDPTVSATDKEVEWALIGQAPCRKFVVNWRNIPQFSCTNTQSTFQCVLYENTNVIEMYILQKPACTGWQSGKAVVGVQNATGTQAVAAPGRNSTVWTTTTTNSEAWQFVPNGASLLDSIGLYNSANTLVQTGTAGPPVNGVLTATFTNACVSTTNNPAYYYVRATYNSCSGADFSDTTGITVSMTTTPPAPVVTSPVTYCQGATATALTATGTNLLWYTASTGGTGSSTAPIPSTATAGTTTRYVSQTVSGCESARTPIVVTITPQQTPAFTPAGPYCTGAIIPALPTTSGNGITGTWSPAINNTATTTYTFTPAAGQCATSTTMQIVINNNITPSFTQAGPYCSGASIPALPTTSGNGVTGSWSPAINNTATTTYTFTPSAGQCANSTTMSIVISPNVTPTFTQAGPYCSGASIPALPTTSGNGVTGSWSPAINNTATTTYTFTPAAGQCANTATMTIVVNPVVTPAFTQAGPYCTGATIPALPTTSNNGITGSWSPAINNTATTTYTFTPSAGQCATSTTMQIVVDNNITPTFTQAGPYCTGATIPALPTTSNNGITGTWSPAINNTATTTYTFTPSAGQCATSTTMQIVINNNITPSFTQVGPYCSGATIPALPTTSNNGITGSWSPAINNTATTTYTFTPSAGQCANTTTMSIVISPNVTPTFTQAGPYCSGDIIPALPTTSGNGITGSWSPAINNTATTTYTFTPAAGQCANTAIMTIVVNPMVTPAFTQAGPYCTGATIPALPTTSNNGITGSWSPAINNTATTTYTFTPAAGQCATTTTMQIVIDNDITPTFTQAGPYCSGTTIPALPTTSNNGITGTWSPAINNTATTTYTFTPAAGQCATSTTMIIVIGNNIAPTFTQVGPYCSGVSIPALPTTSNNGITGSWSPAINNTATTTYTFTPSAGQCATTATMQIVINNNITPLFTQAGPYCSGATIPALPTTSGNGITGSWSPAINNTATTTYTFTPSAGQCANTATMTIVVNPMVTPAFTQTGPYCSGATIPALPTTSNNGITGSWSPAINNTATTTYTFTPSVGQCATSTTMQIVIDDNLTPLFTQTGPYCSGATIPALPTTSNNGITGNWSPAINNAATTTYTFTPSAGQCASTSTMQIVINNNITPSFTQAGPYCAGATIPALPTTSNNGITGSWSPAINNTATTTYTFTPAAGQCAASTTMTIVIGNNITPMFTQAGPYCEGATIPALPTTSNNGITGSWSPAINNTATTTYTFTPASGCATSTTMTIVVSPVVNPSFTQTGPYCAGATIPALPTTSNNGITGSWSPALNNTATTTYTFTPAAGQCATATTMTIVVNPLVTPTFTQTGPYCAGAIIPALPATSNNGISGSWSPAINNTATTTYTFTPSAGQCATSATMQIVIDSNITPVFTQVSPICAGGTLNALPTTANNGITGSWSPAINNMATTTYTFTPSSGQCAISTMMTIVVNPIVTPAFTQVGPYCAGAAIPALATTSNNGITGTWTPAINNTATSTYTFTPAAGQCATTVTMSIVITPNITPLFTQVPPICSGGTLNALPTTANNGVTGSWSPALNNIATTTYTFTPSAGQCATTATMTIVVNPNVTPLFTQVAPVCPGITIPALPTTSNNGITGTWSPALNNMATTTYTFTPASGQSCVLSATMQITVLPYLTGQKNVRICEGDAYTFNGITYTTSVSGVSDTIANAGACDSIITLDLTVVPVNPVVVRDTVQGCGSVVYNGQQYSVSTQLSDTLTTILGCDSIYKSVTLLVYPEYHDSVKVDVFGCDSVVYNQQRYYASTQLTEVFQTIHGCDSLVKIVDIEIYHFELSASMSPEEPYAGDPFTIETDGGNVVYDILSWTPANLFPDQNAKTQRISLTGPEQIIITGSSRGCVDTATINIGKLPVYSTDVGMPNAFSPNGDGLNDVFRPVFKLEKDYKIEKFHVYNRYGEIVYATANLNGGWDGYYKGRLQDQGVYYYYVKIKFRDDSEKIFKGDVTLVR